MRPFLYILFKLIFIPLINGNELNTIFFMSDINMQVVYGISLEDLVKQYSNSNKKVGK